MNALALLNTNLADVLALPDPEAAERLNERIGLLDKIQRVHERSFAERGIIIREFERRRLWSFLIDPDTGTPFSSLTAWLSCSDFLGCRRTNFEAKKSIELLADVPTEKLIDIPKGNLHVLAQLSTKVRNDPAILEAAKTDRLLEKVELEHPDQHLEVRKPIRLNPGRSDAKVIEQWVEYAMAHDLAGSMTEAIVKACEQAMHDALLDEELEAMKAEEEVENRQV